MSLISDVLLKDGSYVDNISAYIGECIKVRRGHGQEWDEIFNGLQADIDEILRVTKNICVSQLVFETGLFIHEDCIKHEVLPDGKVLETFQSGREGILLQTIRDGAKKNSQMTSIKAIKEADFYSQKS